MDDKQKEFVSAARSERRQREEMMKNKKDWFSSVTLCQSVICILLFLVIFFISKGNTQDSKTLKEDYANLLSYSFENTDAKSVVKMISEFLNEPVNLMPAYSVKTQETENDIEKESELFTLNEEDKIEKETTVKDEETENSGEIEKETTTENSNENMGGEDVEVYEAASNTTFSPIATTCKAVSPVNSTNYTSYFGYRISPITQEKSFHTGLDIAAAFGENVYAAYSGTVRKTGSDSRSGKYVIITHSDNFETFYCHLSEICVSSGQSVNQGQVVALVGSTGWSTGPHLHFEIRSNGKRVDPLSVLTDDG